MVEWFNSLPETEKVFVAAVFLGGALFAIRLVLGLFVGGDDFTDGDDVPTGSNAALASFRILSLQGMSAFTIMFGLVGLALTRQEGTSGTVAVFGGFFAGFVTVWVIGRVFVGMGKLESDGTVRLSRAVGTVGTVDLTIPPDGTGKARITIQQRLRVYDAVSKHDTPLRTGDRIKVIDVMDGNILVVEPYPLSFNEESEAI